MGKRHSVLPQSIEPADLELGQLDPRFGDGLEPLASQLLSPDITTSSSGRLGPTAAI
jgi:hypothetical protein